MQKLILIMNLVVAMDIININTEEILMVSIFVLPVNSRNTIHNRMK